MAAELKKAKNETSSRLNDANKKLDKLNKELKLDLVQAGVDIAGIADPTPASDGVSAGMSLARGDFLGAGLSLVSMIPYAGDALAKPYKGTRIAAKIAKLEKKIVSAIAATKAAKASIAETRVAQKAAAAVRKARSAAAKARIAVKRKKCATCKIEGNIFNTDLPKGGTWKGKTKGHGDWEPDWNSDRGKIIEKGNKQAGLPPHSPIKYNKGYPDFSKYSSQTVEIQNMSGKNTDFTAARNKVREKLNNPKWIEDKNKWTWHHNEDGVTMQLVPKSLHAKEGVPHTGGRSIIEDSGY